MKVSLRQVAQRAGVSGTTVSRVLNGADERISSDTRRKVMRAAQEMGYQANRAARALATGRTQTVALWNPNLGNPYYAGVMQRVCEETARRGFDLWIDTAQHVAVGGVDTSAWTCWPVDGIIAVDLAHGVLRGISHSTLWGKPFVSLGVFVCDAADHVRSEFAQQVREAIYHLSAVGCRRIAHLCPAWYDENNPWPDDRLRAYRAAMEEMGLEPELIRAGVENRRAAAAALADYVQQRGCPDGLFCYNDDMAVGALRTLRDMGRRVPEDVAVVGFDGIEETEYSEPALSTIVQPVRQMCSKAWEFLAERVQDPCREVVQESVPARLAVRASSARRK